MRPNLAFGRAVNGLTHPLSIAAILILLFNDHWLRWHYPFWLTGKLGDFVWLIFAPFIAALLFSWLIPRRLKHHESIVVIVSFALIGVWFVLGKTEPTVHRFTVSLLETLMNWRDTLRMDASDLLTLPGLLVGYWIWRHAESAPFRTRPAAYVACALGIMATLANSPAPADSGIGCIDTIGGQLFTANSGYSLPPTFYTSKDGGVTWEQSNVQNLLWQNVTKIFEQCPQFTQNQPFILVDPTNANIQYRFQKAHSIERSEDNGQSWKVDIDLFSLGTEAHRAYYSQEISGRRVVDNPGPLDATFDKTTGNLVVTMGLNGILVRTSDGNWNWIEVGPYHYVNINQINRLATLLQLELMLAAILIVLVVALHLCAPLSNSVSLGIAVVWVLWGIGVVFPPAKWIDLIHIFNLGDFTLLTDGLAAIMSFVLMVGTIANIRDKKISAERLRETLLLALGSAALFLFPYLLWSQGTIPNYSTASIFGLLLGLSAAVGTGQYLKRRYPATIPEKAPDM